MGDKEMQVPIVYGIAAGSRDIFSQRLSDNLMAGIQPGGRQNASKARKFPLVWI